MAAILAITQLSLIRYNLEIILHVDDNLRALICYDGLWHIFGSILLLKHGHLVRGIPTLNMWIILRGRCCITQYFSIFHTAQHVLWVALHVFIWLFLPRSQFPSRFPSYKSFFSVCGSSWHSMYKQKFKPLFVRPAARDLVLWRIPLSICLLLLALVEPGSRRPEIVYFILSC